KLSAAALYVVAALSFAGSTTFTGVSLILHVPCRHYRSQMSGHGTFETSSDVRFVAACEGNSGRHSSTRRSHIGVYGISGRGRADHSGLMLAARMTFPSLSVSAATNFPR